jgi:hypothetical protein
MGFLQRFNKTWRGVVWEDNFFLLGNLGLLVFEKPGVSNFILRRNRKSSLRISSRYLGRISFRTRSTRMKRNTCSKSSMRILTRKFCWQRDQRRTPKIGSKSYRPFRYFLLFAKILEESHRGAADKKRTFGELITTRPRRWPLANN